jgi:AAA family ATP:ADP antiporter
MATNRPAVLAAATASAAMIAFQVAGKATRDALFLSSFPVTRLPLMVIASAVISLLVVLWAVRRMSRYGPWRFIPAMFATSVVLLLLEWALFSRAREAAAVLVYLHFTVLGALLISGFWSMVNERFDPRTAKRQMGRIGAAGTVGGLIGGLLAERTAAMFSVDYMLPLLAGLHLVAFFGVRALRKTRPVRAADHVRPPAPTTILDGLRMVGRNSYLRNLTTLVILCTVSEGLLDFVFKSRATAVYGNGDHLLRVFAAFYTGVALLTFLVQSAIGRVALERMGLSGAVGSLPAAVGVTGVGALLVPGFWSAALSRGTEAVLHNSLFRSGYEILFTPLPRHEKRATKTMIDVGAVRIGDIVGAALVQLAIMLLARGAVAVLLGTAVVLAAVSLLITRMLQDGYRQTLEKSLVAHGVDEDFALASATMEFPTVFETLSTIDLGYMAGVKTPSMDPLPVIDSGGPAPMPEVGPADPTMARIMELRSGDRGRVRAALEAGALVPALVPNVIPLLAWDEVARSAADALRGIAPAIVGQLLDALLDPEQEFSVRRRIPGILISAPTDRTVDGLLQGLQDKRFEVRYRAGRALVELQQRHELRVPADRVVAAVEREVTVDRSIWESQRLLGGLEDASEAPLMDEFLQKRAGRSMEHVFTMLSLVLPPAPLKIAYRGLYTDDDQLRGTALEYLENALPDTIRRRLWPFLEDRRTGGSTGRAREEIIADLLASNQSIALNLEELRKKVRAEQSGS